MTEAEYIATSDAAKEALWLGRLVHTFQQVESDSTPFVYSDSQGAITLLKNPVHHNASKHIDIQYQLNRSGLRHFKENWPREDIYNR